MALVHRQGRVAAGSWSEGCQE